MSGNKAFEDCFFKKFGVEAKTLHRYQTKYWQEFFEYGQQSEREKHRWIPVTERFPTEKDGNKQYDGFHDYINLLIQRDSHGFCEISKYFLDTKQFDYYGVIAWQSLPEV